MLADDTYATWDEYVARIAILKENSKAFPYLLEWRFATGCGWDQVEFEGLYKKYVESTQINLKPEDNATELKGRPLEVLVRYFLEKGGLVSEIKEITDHGKWQVDGYGLVNKHAVLVLWGEERCLDIGMQVYLEAKNHSDPVKNEEFSVHCRRMLEHHCNLGVMVSTSGYMIGKGLGIAESIYHNSAAKRFHILLVFQSLRAVLAEGKAPMAILGKALLYAFNNLFAADKEVREAYSPEACHKAAREEYVRLFGSP